MGEPIKGISQLNVSLADLDDVLNSTDVTSDNESASPVNGTKRERMQSSMSREPSSQVASDKRSVSRSAFSVGYTENKDEDKHEKEEKEAEKPKLTYVNNLAHLVPSSFAAVTDQLHYGGLHVRHMANTLTKIAKIEEDYSKKIRNAVDECHKFQHKDRILSFNSGWLNFTQQYKLSAEEHAEFARCLTAEAVDPMLKHAQDIESNLNKYKEREKKAAQDLKELQKQYYSTRSQTNKLLKKMKKEHAMMAEAAEENHKRNTSTKSKVSLFKKIARRATTASRSPSRGDLTTTNEKAAVSAERFRTAVKDVNNGLTKYYEEIVPHIFHVAEHVERTRLTYVKSKLQRIAKLKQQFLTREQEGVVTLARVPRELNVHQALEAFIRQCSNMQQKQNPDELFDTKDVSSLYECVEYDLPVSPEDIRAGRHCPQPNSVFGATLERCMQLQQDDTSCATLTVPRIADVCIRGVKENHGLTTEGIFRVSAASSELQRLIKQFDAGDYSLSQSTPHVYAATLKHWLRNLLDPVIPDQLYAECIALVRENPEKEFTKKEFRPLFGRLSKVNQDVVRVLAGLCTEITREDNAQVNRMNISNLAIVFAPCLLRNPSEDPSELMAGAKYEKMFIERLFISVAGGL